jgi:hypothetical protein
VTLALQVIGLVTIGKDDSSMGDVILLQKRRMILLSACVMPLFIWDLLCYLSSGCTSSMAMTRLARMILKIATELRHFSIILFMFLLGFGGSYMLLFNDQFVIFNDDVMPLNSTIGPGRSYGYDQALMAVYNFIFGVYSMDDMLQTKSPFIAIVLLFLFLYSVVIVLLNLLIVIMKDKYDELQLHAEAETMYAKAKLIFEYDAMIPQRVKEKHRLDWYPQWLHVLKKEDNNSMHDSSISTTTIWQGQSHDIKQHVRKQVLQTESKLHKDNQMTKRYVTKMGKQAMNKTKAMMIKKNQENRDVMKHEIQELREEVTVLKGMVEQLVKNKGSSLLW